MKPVGREIIRLESVDSTNNYVANLIKQGNIAHGSVILAVDQFAGRGQRGAEWLVKPGENLTCSIYLGEVKVSVEDQFLLTKMMSLAVVHLLLKWGVRAEIKWPNDIFVGTKKIAGMLIENTLSGVGIKHSIIGIGLNVNQTEFGEIAATSIKKETGQFLPIEDVLYALIGSINSMLTNSKSDLDRLYLEELYLRDRNAQFEVDGKVINGVIQGVDDAGRLIVIIEQEERSFDLKEIRFIPQSES